MINFQMDFANCKMSSEFILLFAESLATAKSRMMNSDDILQFAESIENLLFLINSAFYRMKVEFHILIRF